MRVRRSLLLPAIVLVTLGSTGLARSAVDRAAGPSEPLATPPTAKAGRSIPAGHGLKSCPGSGAVNFGHYYLGQRFERLPLDAVLRDCDRRVPGEPYPGRTNVITYVYGDCKVPDTHDGGCLPPLEVTSAPACEDNISLYYRYPDERGRPTPHKRMRLRSTDAASFDGGRQVEIYTGETTITIAGDDPRQVRRATRMLRSGPPRLRVTLNARPRVGAGVRETARAASKAATASGRPVGAVAARAAMANPARGAMAGKLGC